MSASQNCEIFPYLSIADAAKAIGFYTEVFGVEPVHRLDMPDGSVMHCEFGIGNARFFLSEELPEHGGNPSPSRLGATSVAMHLIVDDCDAVINTMKDNGATVLMEPEDMFWGERFGKVRDPFGHEWGIATKLREMSPDEIAAAARQMFEEMAE